jgi:hypothetical protein
VFRKTWGSEINPDIDMFRKTWGPEINSDFGVFRKTWRPDGPFSQLFGHRCGLKRTQQQLVHFQSRYVSHVLIGNFFKIGRARLLLFELRLLNAFKYCLEIPPQLNLSLFLHGTSRYVLSKQEGNEWAKKPSRATVPLSA